jgi:hypothetical protein
MGDVKDWILIGSNIIVAAFFYGKLTEMVRAMKEESLSLRNWVKEHDDKLNSHAERIKGIETACDLNHPER